VLALSALAAVACGAPDEEESKPRPLPDERQELRPGEYRTDEFEPPLTFRVGEGWTTDTPEAPEVLRTTRTEGEASGFTNIREAYKPAKSDAPAVAAPPRNDTN
jgi:hypothetical protein